MSKSKTIFVICLLTAVLLVLGTLLCLTSSVAGTFPNITQMNYNKASGLVAMKAEKFLALSDRISMTGVTFCAELGEENSRGERITPTLTDENYFNVYGNIIYGNGLSENIVSLGERCAVIGSNLALKLFFNENAVGRYINIGDEEYKICGIYRQSGGFIDEISKDERERVYIPYTCKSAYKNLAVNLIAYENSAPSAPVFEQMNLKAYYCTDLAEKSRTIENFIHISLFITFISLCAIAILIWRLLGKKLIFDVSANLKENYFRRSLAEIPLKYFLLLLILIGIPAVLIVILLISDFSIYVESKYMPYDNIFDISYYLNAIYENAREKNSLFLTGDNFLPRLYSNSFNILLWVTVIFAILDTSFTAALMRWLNAVIKKRSGE